jgi:hypothetical protein
MPGALDWFDLPLLLSAPRDPTQSLSEYVEIKGS